MFRHRFQLRAADVPLYRLCDQATGNVILLMVVFSPWAFGSAQEWAIWTMNVAGYILGALLLVKLFIRKFKNYPAPRWDSLQLPEQRRKASRPPVRAATRTLAWLTVALLLYCVLHAVNAAATFDPEKNLFLYRRHLDWLPHSFDAHRTWFHFWMYLGLAATFWSLRDWLLGRTAAEEKIFRQQTTPVVPRIPERLRRLFWLLAINGTLLGLEAIVQHASGSNKLLFLVEPAVNSSPTGDAHFGPFGYRSNAAQYFDMLWPLVLGVWFAVETPVFRRAKISSTSGSVVRLSIAAMLAGWTAAALWPAARVGCLHLVFAAGFGLVTLAVGTRVALGHAGRHDLLVGRMRWLQWAAGLVMLAAATRMSADFLPPQRISHHIYAAWTWTLATWIWFAALGKWLWHREDPTKPRSRCPRRH